MNWISRAGRMSERHERRRREPPPALHSGPAQNRGPGRSVHVPPPSIALPTPPLPPRPSVCRPARTGAGEPARPPPAQLAGRSKALPDRPLSADRPGKAGKRSPEHPRQAEPVMRCAVGRLPDAGGARAVRMLATFSRLQRWARGGKNLVFLLGTGGARQQPYYRIMVFGFVSSPGGSPPNRGGTTWPR